MAMAMEGIVSAVAEEEEDGPEEDQWRENEGDGNGYEQQEEAKTEAEAEGRAEDEDEEDDDDEDAESSSSEEYLAKTRARRSRAGALMESLINDEADDELALLFAEQDDDEEFEEGDEEETEEHEGGTEEQRADARKRAAAEGGEDDMEMDSSSDDDEDKGADAEQDDFSGEKELENQERLAAKKRKKQDGFKIPKLRKRVKVDPGADSATATSTGGVGPVRTPTIPPPRPRKKSERISWLPTTEDGPIRSSSRRQTMENKELTHARLKDNAVKRERQIRTMRQAAEQKAKAKPKQMTQDDRLAEAARTERSNIKSLNRWEEMEKRKAEEQRAKLEALQNRHLEGPVVTWWSGVAKWVDDQLTQVGKHTVVQGGNKGDLARKKKLKDGTNGDSLKKKKAKEGKEPQRDGEDPPPPKDPPGEPTEGRPDGQRDTKPADPSEEQPDGQKPAEKSGKQLDGEKTTEKSERQPDNQPKGQSEGQPESQPDGQPDGQAEEQPEGQPEGQPEVTAESKATPAAEQSSREDPPDEAQPSQPPAPQPEPASTATGNTSFLDGIQLYASMDQAPDSTPAIAPTPTTAAPPAPTNPSQIPDPQSQPPQGLNPEQHQSESNPPPHQPTADVPAVAGPPKTEISSLNCVVLEHFDDLPVDERGEYGVFYNPRKPQKLQKTHQDICPITSLPARYRDPQTGLTYANSLAYREIRHLVSNRYAWSGMLGCFTGPVGAGARGVPDRFLLPNAAPPQMALGAGTTTSKSTPTPTPGHAPVPVPAPAPAPATPTPATGPVSGAVPGNAGAGTSGGAGAANG